VNAFDPSGLSWYNPLSWSSTTWTVIGLGAGAIATGALTFGVGDVILAGGFSAGVAVEGGLAVEGVGAVEVSASVAVSVDVPAAATAVSNFVDAASLARSIYETNAACLSGAAAECALNGLVEEREDSLRLSRRSGHRGRAVTEVPGSYPVTITGTDPAGVAMRGATMTHAC